MRIIRALAAPTVALAGLKVYNNYAVHRASLRYPPLGQFVTVDDVRLHYLSRGSGRSVVFIHAAGLVLRDFASTFDHAAAAHQAIAFDRPGYGYSTRPADMHLTPMLNARILHDALGRLGIEQPILVGHSAGGAIALRYALDYPNEVAGLVLISSNTYADGLPFPSLLHLTDLPALGPLFRHTLLLPVARATAASIIKGLFAPGSPPSGYLAMVKAFIVRPAHFAAYVDELKHLATALREQSPRYGEISVPVTILAGANDSAAPPESQAYPLHRAIPHSHLVVFPETGHFAHHQHPNAVLNAIRSVQQEEQVAH